MWKDWKTNSKYKESVHLTAFGPEASSRTCSSDIPDRKAKFEEMCQCQGDTEQKLRNIAERYRELLNKVIT